MSKILPIRLTEREYQMVDEMVYSDSSTSSNRSEWIRLLIHREWNKRKKLGVPSLSYQSCNRQGGRPAKTISLSKDPSAGLVRSGPLVESGTHEKISV
jgi:hypothetical protein